MCLFLYPETINELSNCFLPVTSFSLFPSSYMSWLSVFVCWHDEFFTHSSAGLSPSDFSFFLFTAAHCHRIQSESKLRSAHSFISSVLLSLTRHRSLRERFTCATFLFKSVTVRNSDCLPSSVRGEERAAMVDGLCSSQFPPLCFTVAETKLHYTAWESSFDTVTFPRRYWGTFDIATPRN